MNTGRVGEAVITSTQGKTMKQQTNINAEIPNTLALKSDSHTFILQTSD